MAKKIGFIFAFILIFIGILFGLSTAKYNLPEAKASDELIKELKSKVINGGEVYVNSQKLNGAIKYLNVGEKSFNGASIKGIWMDISKDGLIVIIPVKYKSLEAYVYADNKIYVEGDKIILEPKSIKIGKLPIPVSLVLGKIPKLDENIRINGNRVEIDKKIVPFDVEKLEIKDGALVLSFKKKVLELFEKKDVVLEKKDIVVKNKTVTKTVKRFSKEVEDSLRSVNQSLNRVYGNLKTPEEKAIISTIQSTLNNLLKDPDYPYKKYAESVKAKYKKLPDESKSRIKSALFSNLDLGEVMKLVSVFGM